MRLLGQIDSSLPFDPEPVLSLFIAFLFTLRRSRKEHHMKVNSRLIALMVAMAAGTAAAAGTTAGTVISNTATAVFEDPTGPAGNTSGNVTSNPVTTTVLPIPGFDIQYATTTADGTTGNDTGGTNSIPAAYKVAGLIPTDTTKDQAATAYVAVNTGNVPNYVVNLTANTTNSPAGAPASVKFYPAAADADNNGILTEAEVTAADAAPVGDPKREITSVTIPADDVNTVADEGQVKFFQVLVVPNNAASNATYAASPQGSAPAGPGTVATNTYPAVTEAASDLQFTQATTFTPAVNVVPPSLVPGTTTPITTTPVVVPPTGPTGTPVTDPNNPVSPPNTPGLPSDPSTPGYVDPANPGTSITSNPAGDNQIAYPPADTNTTADVVTFVNTVTNTGIADVVNLFPTDATGAPIGTNNGSGQFTLPDGTIVKFLNPDGSAITTFGPEGYPTINVPAGTPGTANFQTQVTYPDSNSITNPEPTVILVGIDSLSDSGVVADGTTTNTIMPPAMQFGDATTGLGVATVDPVITKSVSPKGAQPTGAGLVSGGVVTSPETTDAAAVFPMDIVNQGEYGDSYTLTTPVVNFPNTAGGTTPAVSVKYVDSTGTELPKNAAGNYITPVVASDEEYKVFLVVVVPDDAAAGSVTVPQTATGNYSTIVATDPNDVVQIAIVNTNPDPVTGNPTSGIDVDKYQTVDTVADPAVVAAPVPTAAEKNAVNALPKDTIRYAIIAKNNFNTPVKNFVLSDVNNGTTNVYTFSNFVSASVTTTGFGATKTPYFSTDGGSTWTTAAPTAVTALGIQVYIDTDGVLGTNNAPTAGDIVPATASIRLDIVVTVK